MAYGSSVAAFGLVALMHGCANPVVGPSGLLSEHTAGEFTPEDRTTFCGWWVEALGGEGEELICMLNPGDWRGTLVQQGGCEEAFAALPSTCAWLVADLEHCTFATQADPCAPFRAPECQPPASCVR